MTADRSALAGFALRVLVTIGLIAGALLLWEIRTVLLLIFAAVLVAVVLRATADGVRRLVPIGPLPALAIAATLIFAVVGGVVTMFGREVAGQFDTLAGALPAAWSRFAEWVGPDSIDALVERFAPGGATIANLAQVILGTVTGAVTGLMLAVLGGIYLALDPGGYRRGLLRLFPERAQPRVDRALGATGGSLRAWLLGQLVSMAVVGILTWLGLMLLGVPSAVALGLIAALLEFVPLVGPIIAAIPGVLIALTLGTDTFLAVVALYVVIQQIEGNILSPVIMRHSVSIPPAVTLFAIFLLGGLFGAVGVLLGGPLTVLGFVLVRELWLNEDVAADR